ncbi:MAG: hypothetical protein GX455_12930 [Phycisphaerae bacterium]|nr:hypothetical protein [Phycisphaerae bacterium]
MDDIQAFEKVAQGYSALLLVGGGLGMVSVGILLWLGGLAFSRAIACVFGIVTGAIGAWLLLPEFWWAWIVVPAVVGVMAMALHRMVLILMGEALVGVGAVGWILIRAGALESLAKQEAFSSPQAAALTIEQTLHILGQQVLVISERIQNSIQNRVPSDFVIPAVLILAFLVVAVILRRWVAALSCSAMGTVLIGVGMIALLLNKGSAPLTRVAEKPILYGTILVGMIAAGTLVQGFLVPHKRKPRPSPLLTEAMNS